MEMTNQIEDEYNQLLKKVQSEPGISDLFVIIGRQQELLKRVDYYLGLTDPKCVYSSSTNTDF